MFLKGRAAFLKTFIAWLDASYALAGVDERREIEMVRAWVRRFIDASK